MAIVKKDGNSISFLNSEVKKEMAELAGAMLIMEPFKYGLLEYWDDGITGLKNFFIYDPIIHCSNIPTFRVLKYRGFFKLSIDAFKDLCHLTQRGIGLTAFEKIGHDILLGLCSTFEIFQQL